MSDSSTPATSVQVMSRMFSLLDVLARESDAAVSLKVASERTGLHPSTAHRILNDLVVGGLVERSGPGSYRLGLRLLELGNLVKARLDVREQAMRPMQELHRLSGHSVSLFIRQEDEALCVERTVAERSGIHVTRVQGLRTPLTRSAPGRILLLNESGLVLQALCTLHHDRLEALQTELAQIRQSGIAQDHDAHDPSLQVAATPILDDLGQVVACLALTWAGGPLSSEWVHALKTTAQRISAALGWRQQP